MERFTLFAETPCETLEKLRIRGVPEDSKYMQNLEAACKQKTQPALTLKNKNNWIKLAGIGALIIGLGTALILINKK